MPSLLRLLRDASRRVLLRPDSGAAAAQGAPLPESMRRQSEAADLLAQMRLALERVEDQVVFGGVIFLNAEPIGALPNPDQAAVHSAALPSFDFFRWPFSALARLAARCVRKFASPFTRRQERFNLDLLETLRRLEDRLETQQHVCRQLRHRIALLESRFEPVVKPARSSAENALPPSSLILEPAEKP
jgi:hypothetical protein